MKKELWDSEKIRPQHDLPLGRGVVASPRQTPQGWVEDVLRTRSIDEALRMVRPLAVPVFIYKKEATKNPEHEFFNQCKNLLLRKIGKK